MAARRTREERARTARAALEQRTAWLLILPSLILALFIIAYPFYILVKMSVYSVSPFGLLRQFVGWQNFAHILADPVFIATVWRTIIWTVAVVGGSVLIAVPVALILNENFIGRGVARTIVMLPWSISLTMTAIVWLWAFDANHGMINGIFQSAGLIREPVQWMARASTAFPIEIAVGILVTIPFTVTIFLGGLSSIPGDIYEAARMDGASWGYQFRRLTLPLMRPFINLAIVLNVIYVFNSFPIIWVMTQGGPDNGTHILVTYLYELAFRLGRPGDAAAVSVIMLVLLFLFTAVYLRVQARGEAS
ncbi:MAG: carbohydrate ABC transporter permease [Acetobacteraceae bacterium]